MKTIFIAFCILFSVTAYGQRNFRPGFIITNDNDSISGFINFKNRDVDASICRFKLTKEADNETIYYPKDIRGYRLTEDGKFYLSHNVEIEGVQREIFLEYLVKGIMDLFYYEDPETYIEYFFFEENGKMTPVSKKPDVQEGLTVKTDIKYKQVLGRLFKDAPSLDSDEIRFEKRTMINAVKDYHNLVCTTGEECITFKNDYKKKYSTVKISLYSGASLTTYSVNSPGDFRLDKSLSPIIGGLFNFYDARISKSFSFQIDASISAFKGRMERLKNGNRYEKYDFDAISFSPKIGPRYTYYKGKFRPTINLALTSSILLNRSSTYHTEYAHETKPYIELDKNEDLTRPVLLGFNAGVGVDYLLSPEKGNFIFCHLEYDYYHTTNSKRDIKTKVNIFQLKLGYTF